MPVTLSFALAQMAATRFALLRTGEDLSSKTEMGNLIISKKLVAPRPALQPSLSLFLSEGMANWRLQQDSDSDGVTMNHFK